MTRLEAEAEADWGALSRLPGNPMIWILIISELAVFGAAFLGYAGAAVLHRQEFLEAQAQLDRMLGGVNTLVLLTSGLFAALATRAVERGRVGACRWWLLAAGLGGLAFLAVKAMEYGAKAELGIGMDSGTFFTLFYLLTGFHALHVLGGLVILAVVAWRCTPVHVETGAAFWHMVDLIWVLLYPVLYLLR